MSSELALSVQSVTKGFNLPCSPLDRVLQGFSFGMLGRTRRHEVLRGVSFDVRRGETVALLGVNGAGKSTLLQMIAGTMSPTGGRIEVHGKVAALLELGAGFSPDFSGRENAVLNARLLGVEENEARGLLPWIIDFSGIGEAVDLPVRHYSSGMFVRLAFAVAAAVRPDIMIIDEALGVGDAAFQAKCYRYLRSELAHVAKIVVSHDMAMIGAMARRAVVLSGGTVAYDGPLSEGLEAYGRALPAPRGPGDTPQPEEGLRIESLRVDGAERRPIGPGSMIEAEVSVANGTGGPIEAVASVLVEDAFGQGIAGWDGGEAPSFRVPPGRSRHVVSLRWPPLRAGGYVLRLGMERARFGAGPEEGWSVTGVAPLESTSVGTRKAILSLEAGWSGVPLAVAAE